MEREVTIRALNLEISRLGSFAQMLSECLNIWAVMFCIFSLIYLKIKYIHKDINKRGREGEQKPAWAHGTRRQLSSFYKWNYSHFTSISPDLMGKNQKVVVAEKALWVNEERERRRRGWIQGEKRQKMGHERGVGGGGRKGGMRGKEGWREDERVSQRWRREEGEERERFVFMLVVTVAFIAPPTHSERETAGEKQTLNRHTDRQTDR